MCGQQRTAASLTASKKLPAAVQTPAQERTWGAPASWLDTRLSALWPALNSASRVPPASYASWYRSCTCKRVVRAVSGVSAHPNTSPARHVSVRLAWRLPLPAHLGLARPRPYAAPLLAARHALLHEPHAAWPEACRCRARPEQAPKLWCRGRHFRARRVAPEMFVHWCARRSACALCCHTSFVYNQWSWSYKVWCAGQCVGSACALHGAPTRVTMSSLCGSCAPRPAWCCSAFHMRRPSVNSDWLGRRACDFAGRLHGWDRAPCTAVLPGQPPALPLHAASTCCTAAMRLPAKSRQLPPTHHLTPTSQPPPATMTAQLKNGMHGPHELQAGSSNSNGKEGRLPVYMT